MSVLAYYFVLNGCIQTERIRRITGSPARAQATLAKLKIPVEAKLATSDNIKHTNPVAGITEVKITARPIR
jgi:hypothetical protein